MIKDYCEVSLFDQEKVSRAKRNLSEQKPVEAAQVFKALSDDTRIKIAYALLLEDELCVCDVAKYRRLYYCNSIPSLKVAKNFRFSQVS